ncbi:MAG: hypothetical protein ACRC2T_07980, partial [Thermoguttaceae bacterium]
IRVAKFTREAVPEHIRKDDLGLIGYDFFVPLDSINGEEKNLSIIAIFMDKKKEITIFSDPPTSLTLRGTPKPKNAPFEERDSMIAEIIDRSEAINSDDLMRYSRDNYETNNNTNPIRQVGYTDMRPEYRAEMMPGMSNAPNNSVSNAFTRQPTDSSRVETIQLPTNYAQAYLNNNGSGNAYSNGNAPQNYEHLQNELAAARYREYVAMNNEYSEYLKECDNYKKQNPHPAKRPTGNWPNPPQRMQEISGNEQVRYSDRPSGQFDIMQNRPKDNSQQFQPDPLNYQGEAGTNQQTSVFYGPSP